MFKRACAAHMSVMYVYCVCVCVCIYVYISPYAKHIEARWAAQSHKGDSLLGDEAQPRTIVQITARGIECSLKKQTNY